MPSSFRTGSAGCEHVQAAVGDQIESSALVAHVEERRSRLKMDPRSGGCQEIDSRAGDTRESGCRLDMFLHLAGLVERLTQDRHSLADSVLLAQFRAESLQPAAHIVR